MPDNKRRADAQISKFATHFRGEEPESLLMELLTLGYLRAVFDTPAPGAAPALGLATDPVFLPKDVVPLEVGVLVPLLLAPPFCSIDMKALLSLGCASF